MLTENPTCVTLVFMVGHGAGPRIEDTMKTETFEGEVSTAYGKTLDPPVKFSGSFDSFENYEEAETAKELLSKEDELGVINAKRKQKEAAKAKEAALKAAGIEKPDPNSPEVLRDGLIKGLMKRKGLDEATATQVIDELLNS